MFLHSWHPQPILVHLGSLTIHWYGLTLALGALAGFFLIRWIANKYRLSKTVIFDVFLVLIIAGLIGARLYHVVNEWSYYSQNPGQIIQIWHGGLAWHGGLLAGLIGLIIFARQKKLSFWLLADVITPGLALGQAIGRFGNYFNQELFGRPTSLPWSIPIDPANRPDGFTQFNYFHPTFVYEALGLVVIVGVLVWMHRRRWLRQNSASWSEHTQAGFIALTYLLLAAGLRVATESLRLDRTPTIDGLRLPIIVGGLIIIAVIATWFILKSRRRIHVA